MEIGGIIKNARIDAGLTQEQAAEALGVSRQTVSNWENGRSYPDIISVIKMSELYSVSLDRLLKEEASVKKTYREFLEESTDTVKSRERQSKIILVLGTVGVWALSVLAFFLAKDSVSDISVVITWAILPVLFFTASFIIGYSGWFGGRKWLTPLILGGMAILTGGLKTVAVEGAVYRAVTWPDFSRLPIGLLLGLAGLGAGSLIRSREGRKKDQ